MGALKEVSQYFEVDHQRLDRVFKQFQQAKRVSVAESKPFFKTFNNGLKRHIVWEEDLLFPIFEKNSGMRDTGPTAVMRSEHRQIGALLERIHDKIRSNDPGSDAEEAELLALLGAHNQKEEQVLYPAIDGMMSAEEAAELFVAMENIPAERYQTCCGGHH